MDKRSSDVIIIGGGLTGLATAFFLKKSGKTVTVIEKNDRLGGSIKTIEENGFLYECGPNTGTVSTIEMQQLLNAIADDCKPIYANRAAAKRYILKNRVWEALPSGLLSAIKTPLFKKQDKLKVLSEPFRKKGTNPDETVAELVRRRLGNSFLDYAVNPFISGIYAGDPEKLVTKYALQKLYDLEQEYGSFIRGSIKKKKAAKRNNIEQPSKKVFSTEKGLGGIIESLASYIGDENIYINAKNVSISPSAEKVIVELESGDKKQTITAKNLVTAVPAYSIPELMPFINEAAQLAIKQLHYAAVTEVILGWNKWEGKTLDGFGILIPKKEERSVLGILFISSIFEGRCPEGGALMTAFMGGENRPYISGFIDEQITKTLSYDIPDMMGINEFNPDLLRIIRHKKAIPQYYADTKERLEAIEQIEKKYSNITIGGNLINGIGMHDRVKQAHTIAEKISNKK